MLMPMTVTYDIYIDDGWNGPFRYVDTTSGNSYNITYLKSGLQYKFKLKAENIIGYSEFNTESWMICGEGASSPSTPMIIDLTPFKALFWWEEPYDNGGNEIESYTLEIFNMNDVDTKTFLVIDS